MTDHHPRLRIVYCTRCGFMLRAAWLAQELLSAFAGEIAEVALVPSGGGVFEVYVDDRLVYSRQQEGCFLDAREVKQRIGDRIAPQRRFGHGDEEQG